MRKSPWMSKTDIRSTDILQNSTQRSVLRAMVLISAKFWRSMPIYSVLFSKGHETRTIDLRNANLQPIAPIDIEIKGQIWLRPVEPPGQTGRELPAVQEGVAPKRCLSAAI